VLQRGADKWYQVRIVASSDPRRELSGLASNSLSWLSLGLREDGGELMAYSEALAQRVRALLPAQGEVREQKMFGGLTFLLRGNMCCGILGDELMVRVGPEQFSSALAQPHARMIDFTGRPMKGMVMVAPEGVAADEALAAWVGKGVAFAASLPAK
jgi:hypothetical protein